VVTRVINGASLRGRLRARAGGVEAPPLDGFSPTLAHSVRRLFTSYTGALVRIRRSSDNAELNFLPDSNGVLSLSSQDDGTPATTTLGTWIGANSGFVRTWFNQGTLGAAANVGTTTLTLQPRIINAGALDTFGSSSRPSLVFDANDELRAASIAATSIQNAGLLSSILLVNEITSPGSLTVPVQWNVTVANNRWALFLNPGAPNWFFDSGDAVLSRASYTGTAGNPHLDFVARNSGSWSWRRNNSAAGSGSGLTTGISGTFDFGIGGPGFKGGTFKVSECVVFPDVPALSGPESNIVSYYGPLS
jgi:hypothetical protein